MPEPITPSPPRQLGRRLLRQDWLDVTMVHWRIDAAQVLPLLPAGTRPDELNGSTFVGIIGFRMHRLGFGVGPAIPHVGSFLETNVRLYTVDDDGRRGVFFCSLDADRLLAVLGGRYGVRIAYRWAQMSFRRERNELTYACRRRWPRPHADSSMRVAVGPALPSPTELEHFVTARWGLHTRRRGRTIFLPNVHQPWPLHQAELLDLRDDPATGLIGRAGLRLDGQPPVSVLHSPGVHVKFGSAITVQ